MVLLRAWWQEGRQQDVVRMRLRPLRPLDEQLSSTVSLYVVFILGVRHRHREWWHRGDPFGICVEWLDHHTIH